MNKLQIYEFQLKRIEDALRIVANTLKSHERETSLDRSVMQALEMARNALKGDIDKDVHRFPQN